jgi:phage shock protein C
MSSDLEPGGARSLQRPREDRVIAGVCAGLARYLGWPSQRVRIAYVLLSVLSAAFPGILVYAILWYVMPQSSSPRRGFRLDDPSR